MFLIYRLVLSITILLIDKVIENRTRIVHFCLLTIFKLYLEVLRKPLGKKTPNTISIKFERYSDTINKGLSIGDNTWSDMSDHCSHLHWIPSCAFPHDITIETVQNNFVSQLHWFKKCLHVVCFLPSLCVSPFRSLLWLALPNFHESLKLVSTVTKCPHRVNVERILPHADSVLLQSCLFHVNCLVRFLGIHLNSRF